MKKLLLATSLCLLLVPVFVSAAWWNPLSWNKPSNSACPRCQTCESKIVSTQNTEDTNKISELTKQLDDANNKITSLKSQLAGATSAFNKAKGFVTDSANSVTDMINQCKASLTTANNDCQTRFTNFQNEAVAKCGEFMDNIGTTCKTSMQNINNSWQTFVSNYCKPSVVTLPSFPQFNYTPPTSTHCTFSAPDSLGIGTMNCY